MNTLDGANFNFNTPDRLISGKPKNRFGIKNNIRNIGVKGAKAIPLNKEVKMPEEKQPKLKTPSMPKLNTLKTPSMPKIGGKSSFKGY